MRQELQLATVPMDPTWLPIFALLSLGVAAAISGVVYIRSRRVGMVARAWGVSLLCFALVFVSAKALGKAPRPKALVPAHKESISLIVGGVLFRIDNSPEYVLAVDGTPFLELDTRGSHLRVSGVIGNDHRALARVSENAIPARHTADLRPAINANAIWVQQGSRRIFSARYDDPSTIVVSGDFFGFLSSTSALISCNDGIRWNGSSLPAGTTIDLRGQGPGVISFEESGAVRIRPN